MFVSLQDGRSLQGGTVNTNRLELRFRIARPWLFTILIVGFLTTLLGKVWLFAEAGCKPLQDALLYATVTTMVVIMCFRAIFARNNSPLAQLLRVLWVIVVGFLVSATLGSVLSQMPAVKEVFCSQCTRAIQNAENLRSVAKGDPNALAKLDSAEFFVWQCIAQGGAEAREGEVVLAQILFDKSGVLLENKHCQDAWIAITAASDVMSKSVKQSALTQLIAERKRVVQMECTRVTGTTLLPPPNPTISAILVTPTIHPSASAVMPASMSPTSTSATATPMALLASGSASQANAQVEAALITSAGSIISAILSSAVGMAGALGAVYLREKFRQEKGTEGATESQATKEQEE
jgi:hypothetical protein